MKSREIIIFMAVVGLCGAQIVFPGEGSKQSNAGGPPDSNSITIPSRAPDGKGSDGQPVDPAANPQARFLPGLFDGFGKGGGLFGGDRGGIFGNGGFFGGIGNFFNPCSRCTFTDIRFASNCCQRGERHCCRFLGGDGFDNFGPFPVGPGKPGPIGGPFKPVGPPGFIPGGGGGFGGRVKPGFCPKPSLFEGILGTRSVKDDQGDKKVALRTTEDGPIVRSRRQAPEQPPSEDPQANNPQARFFPGLENFPNPFCRDECFTDFDCPGHLKCCINFGNCRDCARPRFL